MFQSEIISENGVDTLHIINTHRTTECDIILSHGCLIGKLILKDESVVDGFNDYHEILNNPIYKSCFLAPFPNRIQDGKYTIEETEYQLPINEEARNMALHGLLYNKPFELVEKVEENDTSKYVFHHDYKGDVEGYPFPFSVEITMIISFPDGLRCHIRTTNNHDASIPYGTGWHPYLELNYRIDDLELKLPEVRKFQMDDNLIPTGLTEEFTQFKTFNKIGPMVLDDCFEIVSDRKYAESILRNSDGISLTLWHEIGDRKFRYLQIYTPELRESIAIEPQTACVNAFNNKIGLFEIQPNETHEVIFGLRVN